MATRKVDALVLDACLRQSLVCMRSLGAAGLTVGAADARRSPAASSRWCSAASILPSVTSPHDFLRAVRAAIERFEPRAVITSHDGSIDVLRPHRKTLGAPLALADEPALALAGSKAQTYALADQIGVRRPAGASVTSAEELTPALAELPPPIVVKPDTSWLPGQTGGRRARAVLATDAEEARRVARGLLDNGAGVVLLQEWIGGRREAVSLLRAGGEVHMRFAQVAFRMAPPLGGSSVLRESIELPADAVDAAEQLADAIDLEGYSEVEFRRDRAGAPVLMEVNARLSASVEVAVRAGVDFPRALFAWAAGDDVPAVSGYRPGVRMRWLGGDVSWLWRTWRTQGLPDSLPATRAAAVFIGDFFRPAAYDYVTANDLVPAVVASGQFAANVVAHVTRRGRRSVT